MGMTTAPWERVFLLFFYDHIDLCCLYILGVVIFCVACVFFFLFFFFKGAVMFFVYMLFQHWCLGKHGHSIA